MCVRRAGHTSLGPEPFGRSRSWLGRSREDGGSLEVLCISAAAPFACGTTTDVRGPEIRARSADILPSCRPCLTRSGAVRPDRVLGWVDRASMGARSGPSAEGGADSRGRRAVHGRRCRRWLRVFSSGADLLVPFFQVEPTPCPCAPLPYGPGASEGGGALSRPERAYRARNVTTQSRRDLGDPTIKSCDTHAAAERLARSDARKRAGRESADTRGSPSLDDRARREMVA